MGTQKIKIKKIKALSKQQPTHFINPETHLCWPCRFSQWSVAKVSEKGLEFTPDGARCAGSRRISSHSLFLTHLYPEYPGHEENGGNWPHWGFSCWDGVLGCQAAADNSGLTGVQGCHLRRGSLWSDRYLLPCGAVNATSIMKGHWAADTSLMTGRIATSASRHGWTWRETVGCWVYERGTQGGEWWTCRCESRHSHLPPRERLENRIWGEYQQLKPQCGPFPPCSPSKEEKLEEHLAGIRASWGCLCRSNAQGKPGFRAVLVKDCDSQNHGRSFAPAVIKRASRWSIKYKKWVFFFLQIIAFLVE